MLRLNKMKLPVAALLLVVTAQAFAVAKPTGEKVERMLKSPGARELMDEEVQLWQRQLETKKLVNRQMVLNGTFVLRGNPSPAQRFNRGKLIRCNVRTLAGGQFAAERNSCDLLNPSYVPLSAGGVDNPTAVAPGFYILGFENSVYPGFLQIKAGQTTAVDLQTVAIPAGGTVKVYRDLTTLTEQFKMYLTSFVLADSVFKLAEYPFGDLYIKTFGMRDGTTKRNYKFCEQAKLPELTKKGDRVCKAWNSGTFMMMTELFDFAADGSFTQWEVMKPGKPYGYKTARLLVAKATTSADASFVNVLPGAYTVEVSGLKGIVSTTTTGGLGVDLAKTLSANLGWMPVATNLAMNGNGSAAPPAAVDPLADSSTISSTSLAASDEGSDDDFVPQNQTCGSASKWRTEFRAYCTSDASAGCNRSKARMCEPMYDTP